MKHEILGIHIDDLSEVELEALLVSCLHENLTQCIATPNAEMLVDAHGDRTFYEALQKTDLNLPDGVSMRFAVSALTDERLIHRHTGIDTLLKLIKISEREEKNILFFGPPNKVAVKAVERLSSGAKIVSVDPGFVELRNGKLEIDQVFIDRMNNLKPNVVAIALPHKKQLAFMSQFKNALPSVKIMIGVGGAIDMIAGVRPRAPRWMQSSGFEWIWRALIEPRRIGRIIKSSIYFPSLVVVEAFRRRRFMRAIRNTIPEIMRQVTGK